MATLETFRERLLEQYRKVEIRPIDFSYAIRTACFRLWLEPSPLKCFTLKQTGEGICICCPVDVDFSCEQVQKLVRAAILRALKKSAGSYLPPLLEALAERYGFSYRKVKITGARSRWGSCSAAGTISLSCYLMLLPPHLMDYVLLHELSHTKEMNHGPRFWELLDSLTEGKALSLRLNCGTIALHSDDFFRFHLCLNVLYREIHSFTLPDRLFFSGKIRTLHRQKIRIQ